MEADKKDKQDAAGTESAVMEGTEEMGYWDFKKQICDYRGWQLLRMEPQIHEVIDSRHEKIAVFRSGEGYFLITAVADEAEATPEKA